MAGWLCGAHARAWWDIHRHRVPPRVHAELEAAVASGEVRLIAARVLGAEQRGDHLEIRLRPRHSQNEEIRRVARAYDCTGIVKDPGASGNPAVRSLFNQGLARVDPLHIGIEVTPDASGLIPTFGSLGFGGR